MLKMLATVYANEKADFDEVIDSLENDGYVIAYQTETSGIVMKEVNSLESNNQNT